MKLKVPKHVADKIVGLSKSDLVIKPFIASGPGGQHRNKVFTAVRITHVETGIYAEATDSRSQSTNKKNAFQKLVKKLIAHYTKEEGKERETNMGWAAKIRTYHEPRNEVKDHRSGATHPYDKVLDGDLDKLIESVLLQENY